jgi:hypothetical protein
MTKGHGRRVWLLFATLLLAYLPPVSASGSGLLLTGDSFSLQGDQEVGIGTVNISIDVHAHDSEADGFLEMTFTAGDNTPLASENRSISLLAGGFENHQFNISSVPIGTHSLTLQLWGDVGVGFENNFTQITVFVQKLSPVNLSIESSVLWDVHPVNGDSLEQSENLTLRDGDHAWVIAEIQNTGDVDWIGNASLMIDGVPEYSIQTTVLGQSSNAVNFSFGPLYEGMTSLEIELVNGSSTIQSDMLSIEIGPPPLSRPILSIQNNASGSDLGENANWTVLLENTGESSWQGNLHCDFPQDVELLNQSLSLQPNEVLQTNISLTVRPATLVCVLDSPLRVHDDAVTTQSHIYDMAAGHIMRAGSDGLTVTGGPFHVGDSIPLAILVHNGGDYAGTASLEVRESSIAGSEQEGSWIQLDTRTLEVGSSLELSSLYTSSSSGDRLIEWRIVSTNSLVSEDCFGEISLTVQPSQSLGVEIDSYSWTLENGLDVVFTTALSSGESRLVDLEVGTSGASGDDIQISAEIYLSPGQRTLTYNLGHPTSSSYAWVKLTPISWSSSSVAEDQLTLIRPSPQLSVSIDSVSPETPVPGEPTSVSFTLNNSGGGATLLGELILIDIKHEGEVLWIGTAPVVESVDSYTNTITLDAWPTDTAVDLSLIWYTSDAEITGTASFLSQSQESSDSGYTVDWVAIVYGALAGLLIGLVTRTVMRARAGVPLMSRRERGERTATEKKVMSKKVEEKVEVACPSCDQRLRIPSTYSGTARCPACAQTFPVEASVELEVDVQSEDEEVEKIDEKIDVDIEQEKSSSSSDDIIHCPDCEQKLKVPYDRRPVRARCPACKCEFLAKKD